MKAAKADQRDGASVWCFWHRCLLPATCFFHGRPRTVLLISASFDGELIARTIERLGYETVRGSSSRAGSSGLRALARAVGEGATAVIPGDGPRGPRYLLKPGVTKLAQLTGLPVHSFYLLPAARVGAALVGCAAGAEAVFTRGDGVGASGCAAAVWRFGRRRLGLKQRRRWNGCVRWRKGTSPNHN